MLTSLIPRGLKRAIKDHLDGGAFVYRLPKPAGNHAILLTFDDGPHPDFTPRILDLLEIHRVRACFFVIGRMAEAYPELLRETIRRGHGIANHTYSHSSSDRLGLGAYAADVRCCQEVIRRITGVEARLFRPPRGRISAAGTLAACRIGARQVFWSNEGGECGVAQHETAQVIGERLAASLRGGDIVLLHDDAEKTSIVLEHILPLLSARGFDLTTGLSLLDASATGFASAIADRPPDHG